MNMSPTSPTAHLGLGVPVTLAAIVRSVRTILRSPTLLISPVAQSLFFLAVYAGQLETVGSNYLAGGSFISFLLPLILLTGAATGAGAAGQLLLRDIDSGYLDRLRLAHGSTGPFLAGPIVAALAAVVLQTVITIAGAFLVGYRPGDGLGLVGMTVILTGLSLGIALLSIAIALRTRSSSATGIVPLVVFGLAFFTGFFAPVEELAPWMRAVATVNPLSYVIGAARQFESGSPVTALPITFIVLGTLIITGIVTCILATKYARRNR